MCLMKLSVFIQKNKEEIVEEWVHYAQENIDRSHLMNLDEIQDHVRSILDRICHDMETAQTEVQQERKSRGNKQLQPEDREAATAHGEQRLDFGFDLMQLSSEFRALRASVLKLWDRKVREENWKTDFYDLIRFNEAIDEIWMLSLERFQSKLDESKNLFLGILGHDLRNPLATVRGANTILSLAGNKTEEEEKALRLSRSSLKRMTELIDNLLELTQLRLGPGMTIKTRRYNLQERVDEIIQELQLGYPEANIILTAPQRVEGEWDILRIDQMLTNLIINAIRHGKADGVVSVKLLQEGNYAIINVHNNGTPIPAQIQRKIFNKGFTKSNNSNHERNYGLGLLVVKEVVEGHEGEIKLNSNEEEGTTFEVKLPLNVQISQPAS